MVKLRGPLLVLGMGAMALTAGCHALGGCANPDTYSGAQNLPRLKIPVGLDGLDTTRALEIPPLTQPVAPRDDEGSCLEDPPPMREAGSNSEPVREAPVDEPESRRRNTIPVGPRR